MNVQGFLHRTLVIGLAVLLHAEAASAQVRSASRHTESDRREMQAEVAREDQRTLDRLAALYDGDEFEAMLELGDGSVRGVMGYGERTPDPIVALIKKTPIAVADREMVFLLPMTRYVEAWYQANSNRVVRDSLANLHPDAWKYMGVSRTDREGNFAFDGLKPGRYIVFAEFPVGFVSATAVDTGQRSISFHGAFGNITGATSKPVYERRYHTDTSIVIVGQTVDVAAGRTTRFRPLVERGEWGQ